MEEIPANGSLVLRGVKRFVSFIAASTYDISRTENRLFPWWPCCQGCSGRLNPGYSQRGGFLLFECKRWEYREQAKAPPEEGEVYDIDVLQPLADVKVGFNSKICLDYIKEISEPDAICYVCILFAGKWDPES